MRLPEIPGVPCTGDMLVRLQTHVATLLDNPKNPRTFPGAQPISFARHHLKTLETENFFVSEKADGIRCLMAVLLNSERHPTTFLVDRKNNYYHLEGFGLPRADDTSKFLDATILDGELVLDVDPDSDPAETLWFLLFDCLVVSEKILVDRPYSKRLGHLKDFIMRPFQKKCAADPAYAASLPFRMDLKKLELSYGVDKVFDAMRGLKHKSDGVIFTSERASYTFGTCDNMLKWKPSDENTVDFKIDVRGTKDKPEYMLQLWEGKGGHVDHVLLELESDLVEEWKRTPPQDKIVECRYDPHWTGTWRFMRFRDDKDKANHISIYTKIMESIADNVERDELVEHAPIIRDKWKRRNFR